MTPRRRALAYLAIALFFGGVAIATQAHDAPPTIVAAGAVGLGASLTLSVVWWSRGTS